MATALYSDLLSDWHTDNSYGATEKTEIMICNPSVHSLHWSITRNSSPPHVSPFDTQYLQEGKTFQIVMEPGYYLWFAGKGSRAALAILGGAVSIPSVGSFGTLSNLIAGIFEGVVPLDLGTKFTNAKSVRLAPGSDALPRGLKIANKTLSGAPMENPGPRSITVRGSNPVSYLDRSFTLSVEGTAPLPDLPPEPPIAIGNLADATMTIGNVANIPTAQVFSGATSYAASGLPSGLSINSGTGVITGTLAGSAGASNVVITPSNADGNGPTRGFTLTREAAAISFETTVMNADKVVVMGASIMANTFNASEGLPGVVDSHVASYFANLGFAGTLVSYAQSGNTAQSTRDVYTNSVRPGIASTAGNNVILIHTGGNNVSGGRPYATDTQAADLDSAYRTLLTNINADGDTPLPMPLAFRHYGKGQVGYPDYTRTPPDVGHDHAPSEANGSGPYNQNVILPAIADLAPAELLRGDGSAYIDPYVIGKRWFDLTGADGIHGYGRTLPYYILSRTYAAAKGIVPQSRSGQTVFYHLSATVDSQTFVNMGNYNKVHMSAACMFYGARTHIDMGVDSFIGLHYASNSGNVLTITGTKPWAVTEGRILDPRFNEMANTLPSVRLPDAGCEFVITDLFPGDVVDIGALCIGPSSSGSADWIFSHAGANVTIKAYSAAGDTTYLDFNSGPLTVPASGEIKITIVPTVGDASNYCHGFAIRTA